MEERKIFDPKFVHFMWDDSLEGKKGFFSDSIPMLIEYVESNDIKHRGHITEDRTKYVVDDSFPFYIIDDRNKYDDDIDCYRSYRFFYYDPMYEIKLAWKQGAQIQARVKDFKRDWVDLENPKWGLVGYEYRVKPDEHKLVFASNGCLSLDIEDVPCILCKGTKEECLKYAKDVMCSRCVNFNTCTPDVFCRGFKEREPEPEKQWRPFKDITELKDTWHRKRYMVTAIDNPIEEPMVWVKQKTTGHTYMITTFVYDSDIDQVCIGGTRFTMAQLFNAYEFLDGTPCGVVE